MREFQIRCEIFDRSEFSGIIKGDEKNHIYYVYADANNFYEAVAMATKNMIDVYQNSHEAPFGRTVAKEDGETVFEKKILDNRSINMI